MIDQKILVRDFMDFRVNLLAVMNMIQENKADLAFFHLGFMLSESNVVFRRWAQDADVKVLLDEVKVLQEKEIKTAQTAMGVGVGKDYFG